MALISEKDRGYFCEVSFDLSEETGVGALHKTYNMNTRKNDGRKKKSSKMVVYCK